jgi:hypothetical protein
MFIKLSGFFSPQIVKLLTNNISIDTFYRWKKWQKFHQRSVNLTPAKKIPSAKLLNIVLIILYCPMSRKAWRHSSAWRWESFASSTFVPLTRSNFHQPVKIEGISCSLWVFITIPKGKITEEKKLIYLDHTNTKSNVNEKISEQIIPNQSAQTFWPSMCVKASWRVVEILCVTRRILLERQWRQQMSTLHASRQSLLPLESIKFKKLFCFA